MSIKLLAGFVVSWQVAQSVFTPCSNLTQDQWTGEIKDQVGGIICQSSIIKDMEIKFPDEKSADDFIATKPPDTSNYQITNVQKKEDK